METYISRSMIALLIFLNVGSLALSSVSERESSKAYPGSLRLPNDTRPVSYDIHLETRVDQGDFNFTGRVKIIIEVLNQTNGIVLHARQLEIKSVDLVIAYYVPEVVPVTYSYDNITEFLTINSTERALTPMFYYLTIQYAGELRKANAGFYVTSFSDENNKQVNIASTQFEATDARHAFPCYDEPAKKAVFKISVKHGTDYFALSNMPVIQGPVDNGDGTSTTTFQQTTLMSTYLVAFTISNFEYSEMQSRIPHRVYSRRGTKSEQKFALSNSVRILEHFEDYCSIRYELPKLDNLAIPEFLFGAMENWGLLTFREDTFLFNDEESTTLTQGDIFGFQAHELAHQWFGNLVSPYWWTYLWLNSAFASLLQYTAAEAVFPEWDMWQRYHIEVYDVALQVDVNSRPMTYYVESQDEINSAFNPIAYNKGASFLNMVRHALGDEVFRKALQYYLKDMEYLAAAEDDLFRNFQVAIDEYKSFGNTKVNVFELFKSWTNQPGYPLLTVTRDYSKGTVVIKQIPFDRENEQVLPDNRTWWVPFNFATAQNPNNSDTTMFDYLNIEEVSKQITLSNAEAWNKEDWIILNKRSTSYYRVNYDLRNWKLLTEALTNDPGQFHVLNRVQLLDDAYAFVSVKLMNISTFLDISVYLKNEVEYAPWAKANDILTDFNKFLSGDPSFDLFLYYVRKIVGNFYSQVGVTEMNDEDHLRRLTRSFAVNWACKAKYGDCLKVTRLEFRDFVQSGKRLDSNVKFSILCFGLTDATEAEYEFMLSQLMNSKDEAFRNSLISSAMGCMQNETLLKWYLETAIQQDSTNSYKIDERINILPGVVAMGPIQFEVAIDFLKANHNNYSKIPSLYNTPPLVSALSSIASAVVNQKQNTKFQEIMTYLGNYAEVQMAKDSLMEIINHNLDWNLQYREQIAEWLDNFKMIEEGESGNGANSIILSTGIVALLITISLKALL